MSDKHPRQFGSGQLNASHPVVIAEIAGAHQGQLVQALALVRAAATTGVAAAKLQKVTATGLLSRYHPRFKHFQTIQFSDEDWTEIIQTAQAINLPLLFDVFDEAAVDFLDHFPGIIGYKIHSSDLNNPRLLDRLAQTSKWVLLGVGGSRYIEVYHCLKQLKHIQNLVIMPGIQAFPTQLEDLNLNAIPYYAKTFRRITGFADHIDAADPLAFTIPVLAAQMGAQIIEKHITLNRAEKGIDYYSSLEPDEMQRLVQILNALPAMMGPKKPVLSPAETQYRLTMKKAVVAATSLKKGHQLTWDDFRYKRADGGLPAFEATKLIGRPLTQSLSEDQAINLSTIKTPVIATIAVRMHSTRCPKKALRLIQNKPTIIHLFDRLKAAKNLNKIVVCTSINPQDDVLEDLAKAEGLGVVRGSEKDVMSRFITAADQTGAEVVVRVTGDDILVDPEILDQMIEYHIQTNADYTATSGLLKGCETEIIATDALKRAHELAEDTDWTEYMTWYLNNPDFFHTEVFPVPEDLQRPDIRLTLDHEADFELIDWVFSELYPTNPYFSAEDIVSLFNRFPEKTKINQNQTARKKTEVKGLNTRLALPML